ncbi:unnamed protein product [Dibothriocephalus latus]|uniref:Uncharacterized protein n=1 Tax=Dibothriocephalus latus TaxID=60516 RepID=A0A3P7M292_DIBLA|nr:unnamed protein product [Dibothriocephalus latus]
MFYVLRSFKPRFLKPPPPFIGDSDEGHHGYTKGKSTRQFSRSGDPSQRYRDEHHVDDGDQKNDQSTTLARGPSKGNNSLRQREAGQNVTAHQEGRSTARRPPKNSKSGNRQAAQSEDADDVDLTNSGGEVKSEQTVDEPATGEAGDSTLECAPVDSDVKDDHEVDSEVNNSSALIKPSLHVSPTNGSNNQHHKCPAPRRHEGAYSVPSDANDLEVWETASEGASVTWGFSSSILGESQTSTSSFQECTPSLETASSGQHDENLIMVRRTNTSNEIPPRQTATHSSVLVSSPDEKCTLEKACKDPCVVGSCRRCCSSGDEPINKHFPQLGLREGDSDGGGNSYTDRRGRADRYGRPRFENRNRGPSSLNGASVIVPLMSINAEAPPSFCNNPSFLDSPSDDSPLASNPIEGDSQAVYSPEQDGDTASAGTNTDSSNDGFTEVRSKSSKNRRRLQKKTQSAVSTDKKSTSPTDPEQQRSSVKTSGQKRQTDEASQKIKQSENIVQPPPKTSPAKKTPKKLQAKNAWTVPLQATISAPTKTEVSSASTVETSKTSYAWSKVVGSKVLPSESKASNNSQPASKPDSGASVNSSEDPTTKVSW